MTTVASKTSSLNAAKAAKNDEFYTQWADIEREMNAYLEYDPDVFRDRVILLPCDDPEWSNFAKFFALHFMGYGLKKLISTSYAPDSNPAKLNYQPSLFEMADPKFDETKTHANGKKFVLEPKDITDDGVINIDSAQFIKNPAEWKPIPGSLEAIARLNQRFDDLDGDVGTLQERARLLQDDNTYVYLCGLKGMEKGVEEAFTALCQANSLDWNSLRPQMLQQGRYHVETY